MTSEEKAILMTKLERKLRLTREKIVQMEEMTQPVTPENSIGRISRMDAINNKSVMEAALRAARQELDDLEYAEQHIDDPEFGICQRCQKAIDVKRLMIMPGAKRCTTCASL